MWFILKMLCWGIIFSLVSSAHAANRLDLTSNSKQRHLVTTELNKELKHLDKRMSVTRINKIVSDYDAYSKRYSLETDFLWKDDQGKVHHCTAYVYTNGVNKKDDRAELPYVCFRIAGLG